MARRTSVKRAGTRTGSPQNRAKQERSAFQKDRDAAVRDALGRFMRGYSGNPGGRPVRVKDFVDLVRELGAPAAFLTLLADLTCGHPPTRAKSAEILWAYGLGKPRVGTARDKRRGASVVAYDLDWKTCESLYRGDDMAARIVERPVREMLRKWVDVLVEGSTEEGKGVTAVLDELGAKKKLRDALCWKRAYGGSAIVLGADDGAVDLTRPLNEKKIAGLRWLTVLDRTEIRPVRFYSNPKGPRYGEPEARPGDRSARGVVTPSPSEPAPGPPRGR